MTLYVGGYPGPYAINIIEEPEIRSFVQSVELRDFYNGDNGRKITRQVLRLLNAVRTLTIGIGFRLFDTGVFRLVRQMPLTEVKLLSVPRVETVFEFYDIPTLTRLNVEKRLNPDDRSFPPARDLEHVLPPSRERTSTITYLRIWWPDAPLYITEKLLLWPANLETVRLHWLPKDSQNSEYNFQTLWEKLLLHAATLKVLEIGALPLRKNDIPNFSGFSNLEKITMYTGDLMCLDPKTAVRMLAAPQLEHLVLNCLKDFAWADHLSNNLVPLTVIKGAGHEYIPLPQGENATTADFHSIRTKTESPAYFTSGFYKIEAGPQRPAHYTFEETKYVLNGQIDILDEATGITHHLVPGDFAFFHVGSKVKVCLDRFSTKSSGFAFYAVTRPVRAPHPNLEGREEKQAKL
ncbi:uncharacterized protein KD926_010834 [Aspergillus affinis]|uniref:uncharacterized protein n=1 Tax=Aspergillus affinis TaxID=1070780 RepID=UPI0022FE5C16|nr:uncharacterized protein KD926_010834 [Aspergillus affinis]KAI9038416.1 hypothetical protein KD926_010834 [Aspergillus affinis]